MRKESRRESFEPPDTENVDQLFETHSVEEINEIVTKLEKEIERKRADLRQIVGEKYKELVEVSDSLQLMNDRCSFILESVDRLDKFAKETKFQTSTLSNRNRLSEKGSNEERLIAIKAIAIIKGPSLIWSALDKDDILSATYLFARVLKFWESLSLVDFPNKPTVSRYADLIKSLKDLLLQKTWNSMKFSVKEEKDCEKIALNLISASYLTELGSRDLLDRFLLVRREQLGSLDYESMDLGKSLRFFFGNILETFRVVFTVFLEEDGIPSLLQRSSLYVRRFKIEACSYKSFSRLLCDHSNFYLSLNHINDDLSTGDIKETCKKWSSDVKEHVDKIGQALKKVDKIDSIFSVLKEIHNIIDDPNKLLNWQDLNEALFDGEVSAWDYFMKDVVVTYIKKLISTKLEKLFSQLLSKSLSTLPQLSHQSTLDLVWLEESSTHMALFNKSYRIYDEITKLLTEFEEDCSQLKDQLSILEPPNSTNQLNLVSKADINELRDFFNNLLKENIQLLLTNLNASFDRNDFYCLLGMADFCRTLLFASPNFKKCHFLGQKELWSESKNILKTTYSTCVGEYLENNLNNLTKTFREEMKVTSLINLLNICSTWNEVVVKETSDDGKTVQSSLRVPIQLSSPLFRFLNSMNEAANQVSAHTMSPTILASLLKPMIVQLKEIYRQLLEEIINQKDTPRSGKQTQILQFLFDTSFLLSIVKMMEDDPLREELICLLVELEQVYRSQIDPVDIHALEPYIETALLKCLETNFLLFGSLFVEQFKSSIRAKTVTVTSKSDAKLEPHILMPSYSFESTFPRLPLEKGG